MKNSYVKVLSLLLAFLMLLSCDAVMTACGEEKQAEEEETPVTPDEPDTPDVPDEPEETDETDEPDTPDEPDTGDTEEDEEPEFEIIKLKNPLKVFGGKHPYDIWVEDGVDRTTVEMFAEWVGTVTGTVANMSRAAAGSFKEENVKLPKIIIGNMNMSWTATAREKMGDASWIISVEDKNIILVGSTDDEVLLALGCLQRALLYYTAHTQSEEIVLPNDFCITSKDDISIYDTYTLTTKKSEQLRFSEFIVTSYVTAGTVDDALCEKLIAGGYNAVQVSCGSAEANIAALNKLAEYGLYCDALLDNRLYSLAYSSAADYTYEQVLEIVKAVDADYAGCDNLLGYFLIDEPSVERFEMLGMIVRAIREVCPNREGYINLFPSYASGSQLGTFSYEDYVSTFMSTVDPQFLQVDNYTFSLDDDGTRINESANYFADLAVLRKWADRYGIDAEFIVQLDRWNESVDQVGVTQVLWEVNMPLAYGFKRISYFTFFEYTGFAYLYTDNFQSTRYEASKEANALLFNIGKELFTKDSVAVYSYIGHEIPAYEVSSYEVAYTAEAGLGNISGTGNAVIGTFDDGSVYFVNRNAYDGDADTYLLGGYTANLEWFDPSDATWKDASTCANMTKTAEGWSITLAPANGLLFRAK